MLLTAQIISAILIPFFLEIFSKLYFDKDTKKQITKSSAFNVDSEAAALLIMERKEKIVSCFGLCYSLFAASTLFLAKNLNSPLALVGIGVAFLFVFLVLIFEAKVSYSYFSTKPQISLGRHWVSYLTFPLRLSIYILIAVFVFAA
jgi:hypothetical protein